jgi:NADH:ubiquinone oxidoreductase subunit 5 (subunit L)/multisubunit Na+/H+ antiporter MnhA subunit
MRFAVRLAFGLAIFLAVAGIVYATTAQEWQGSVLLLVCSVAFVYVGISLRRGARLAPGAGEEEEQAGEEPEEVPATIWPFVFSLAALALVIGAVGIHWVLVLAAILFIWAAVGWFTDIQRQRMHAEAEAASALQNDQKHGHDHDRS